MPKQTYEIAVFPGDGIGPEVIDATLTVLQACQERYGLSLNYTTHDFSAELYRRTGKKITAADMDEIGEQADAVLFGAMGLPEVRGPEGLELGAQVEMRAHYGLLASLRPVRLFDGVEGPLKDENVDMLVIREISEGMFAGLADKHEPSDETATDRMTITRATCEKLFDVAFSQARARRKRGTPGRVTLLHKSNALRSNVLMEKVFDEVAAKNKDVDSQKFYIDVGSMYMVTDPQRYDVIVSENIFGDITSEIAAGLGGGLGIAPSADVSLTHGVFQPSHGSAPDIAGQGIANPIAMILSAAMMLEWLGEQHDDDRCTDVAQRIQAAVETVLANGPWAKDLGGDAGTQEVADAVTAALAGK
ncbi:isocitrate/isopropylmalate dehydrogenase family protein [Gulosibacter chungangensis]|uniref:Isocitrate/isopropylmalate dehydrogenase family protein n=1 Tax=Gulosibacter chungangensis TaxID=979746 RepID=A0A7J5BFE6_9MICO|nr:isocitrate/isopropylmalate family dehydrogenase [Gulosibacter chungangensis]KAB1644996.1 isocitrate/isopropylmalate dehydrogenase family protein [Gulosibacter chungangensis]